jgi:hypothetical protein
MSLADVTSILWREREAIELLLFKLEEEQLVLEAGRTHWLERATREIEIVLDQIRRTEVLRAAEVDAAAGELGLAAAPSLLALAAAAPPAWDDLLGEHRTAFLALAAEVTAVAETNRELLSAGQRSAHEAMLTLAGSTSEAYGRCGKTASVVASNVHLQLQQRVYQAALGAHARVIQPSLLDFLR